METLKENNNANVMLNIEDLLPNYDTLDSKFVNKHGMFKYLLAAVKLNRYKKKAYKYMKLMNKYNSLHSALSLSLKAGFPTTEKYQNHVKSVNRKASEIKGKFDVNKLAYDIQDKGASNGKN